MNINFIPGTLAIIDEYQYVKDEIIPFVAICIFMAVIIMISTGLSAQFFEKLFSKLRK